MNDLELLEQQAVDSAINLDWVEAIKINKRILKTNKNNLNAILRLGFAHLQKHDLKDAKRIYKHALKIQSENQIAQENLERIKILEEKGGKKTTQRDRKFDPNLFLEVPGKTRASILVNLGQKNILAQLTVGEEIVIKPKKIKAEIRTKLNEYIGSLPDDLSKRLYLFIKAGSEYSCFIKDVSLNRVVIFIREEKKGKKVAKYSSFPKNIQTNIGRVGHEEDGKGKTDDADDETGSDSVAENELERLAENLTHEDKDFFAFEREEEDEENLEE